MDEARTPVADGRRHRRSRHQPWIDCVCGCFGPSHETATAAAFAVANDDLKGEHLRFDGATYDAAPMNANHATALAFIARWSGGIESLRAGIDVYFTENTVWENVGINRLVGKTQALSFVEKYHRERGLDAINVELIAVLAEGRKVMTERIDTLCLADGIAIHTVRLMGIFEIEDGKIIAQRDYFCPPGA